MYTWFKIWVFTSQNSIEICRLIIEGNQLSGLKKVIRQIHECFDKMCWCRLNCLLKMSKNNSIWKDEMYTIEKTYSIDKKFKFAVILWFMNLFIADVSRFT